jgi:hypothetical protein
MHHQQAIGAVHIFYKALQRRPWTNRIRRFEQSGRTFYRKIILWTGWGGFYRSSFLALALMTTSAAMGNIIV